MPAEEMAVGACQGNGCCLAEEMDANAPLRRWLLVLGS